MPSGGNNRFSQEIVDSIRRMIEVDNLQHWKIAEALGISISAVERIAKRNGMKTQRTGPRSGSGHTNWKGGRVNVAGYWYVYLPTHPFSTQAGRVAEHRLVMESKLGRYLLRSEVVHHIDGNPRNNDPGNLIAFPTNAEHLREELTGKQPNWTPGGQMRLRKGVERRANLYRLKPDGSQRPLRKYHRKKKSDSTHEETPS